jgi:tight adherence protein C
LQRRYEVPGSRSRDALIQAGDRRPNALGIFWVRRLLLTGGLALLAMLALPLAGLRPALVIGGTAYAAAVGYVLPTLRLRRARRSRQKELQLALPDALDLLVVCVEAGLGMNQAMQRVAGEIRHVSRLMSDELTLVNLEIRAGTPRDAALLNLAQRTGLEDIRSLTTMLIQTDRFGTSVAQSLRVHSDTLRLKRRQRAEEAAAKTTIKMVFPLVFCIFPAIFAVLIGPGIIQIVRTFAGLK